MRILSEKEVINAIAELISLEQACSSCAGTTVETPHCKTCTAEAKQHLGIFVRDYVDRAIYRRTSHNPAT